MPTFGPVIERLIEAQDEVKDIFIDFDGHRVLSPPVKLKRGPGMINGTTIEMTEELKKWLQDEHVDVILELSDDLLGINGLQTLTPITSPPVRELESMSAARAAATGNEKHGLTLTPDRVFAGQTPLRKPPEVLNPPPIFTLKDGSPVIDAGVALPNIIGGFKGKAPDMGALEKGAPELHYGPRRP